MGPGARSEHTAGMVRMLLVLALTLASASYGAATGAERYKAELDTVITKQPWEPEAYLARSGYFMTMKDWPHAAEDWLEARRLWAFKQGESLGIRAPDHAVLLIASVMSAADRAGLDPDETAAKFLATFSAPDEE